MKNFLIFCLMLGIASVAFGSGSESSSGGTAREKSDSRSEMRKEMREKLRKKRKEEAAGLDQESKKKSSTSESERAEE